MKRTTSSDDESRDLGAFQGSISRNSNPRDQAFNHNLGRNVRVAKVLTLVRLLHKAKGLPGTVTCTAARRQNFNSEQDMTILDLPAGPVQAAHFLPGTVSIGGVPIWDYIQDARFRGQVEFLFGDVEHLPAVFNQADTSAEAKGSAGGLCAALAAACHTIITGSSGGDVTQDAWRDWTIGAMIGLRTAIAGKTQRGVLPALVKDTDGNLDPGSIDARGSASRTEWNRDDAVRILGYYLEDQEQRDWAWVQAGCRSAIAEIESAFRA
jgi:hypothetical protein